MKAKLQKKDLTLKGQEKDKMRFFKTQRKKKKKKRK